MDEEALQTEIDRNFEVFVRILPDLLQTNPGKYVVMRGGEVIQSLDTFGDAFRYGYEKFGPNEFSVQQITNRAVRQ